MIKLQKMGPLDSCTEFQCVGKKRQQQHNWDWISELVKVKANVQLSDSLFSTPDIK